MKKYPNDHTAIVGMVNEYGFAEVARAVEARPDAELLPPAKASGKRTRILAIFRTIANAIEAATN